MLPNDITLFVDLGATDAQSATLSRLADIPLAHLSGRPSDEAGAFEDAEFVAASAQLSAIADREVLSLVTKTPYSP